jgi:ATP-dependent RNA helicase RhlE
MSTFNELGLSPQMLATVDAQGYSNPTPIQQATIPAILGGRDLFATAPTGTGKTAAFAIPILQKMMENPSRHINTLVLAPTRELAHQISDNFKKYAAKTPIKITLIYGGVPQFRQVDNLKRGTQIVIATPGRLLDLMEQGYVNLKHVEHFVLDECDRMLDMGFIGDIREIGAKLESLSKQTMLFSATASKEIRVLSEELLNNPERIDIVPTEEQKPKISQWLFAVGQKNKEELLVDLLQDDDIDAMIVFSRTKHGADKLVKLLRDADITACAIHGDKSQRERTRNLDNFKAGRDRILVATDVAARGVDIPALNYVLNFDMAEDPETHTHRIGRTGRAGKEGLAISFCSPHEAKHLHALQKEFGQDILLEMEHDFRIDLPEKHQGGSSQRRSSGNSRGKSSYGRNQGAHKSSDYRNNRGNSENRRSDGPQRERRAPQGEFQNRSNDSQGRSNEDRRRNDRPREFQSSDRNQRPTGERPTRSRDERAPRSYDQNAKSGEQRNGGFRSSREGSKPGGFNKSNGNSGRRKRQAQY